MELTKIVNLEKCKECKQRIRGRILERRDLRRAGRSDIHLPAIHSNSAVTALERKKQDKVR